jgi:hypothetical protein
MKFTILALVLSVNAQAAAFTMDQNVQECMGVAMSKFVRQAETHKFTIIEDSIRLAFYDDRWYNPSKYYWFEVDIITSAGGRETAQVLTQKSLLPYKECF